MSKTYRNLLFFVCLMASSPANAQGRVVINEYLPWPLNGCGVTSEFVELLNFGPGPIDIGCYILTDGDYAITIPPGTILQPGQFYVISGQDIIAAPCDNIDSTIHAHLNWNTCNCTSSPIPTTGDGFLTDGGSSNEQLVLFDPNLNVVDAVVRKLPQEPSSMISTSTAGGACTSHSFDLDLMDIQYETIGESDGRGNSMARKTDGDCGWVKDSQQSGNATNNTPGETSSLDLSFFVTGSQACPPLYGSVLIRVNSGDMNAIFPMRYILAQDINNNFVYDANDLYTYGIDSTPNTIVINNLPVGRYRLVIETKMGCGLHTFDFVILHCNSMLNTRFIHTGVNNGTNPQKAFWSVEMNETIDYFEVYTATPGTALQPTIRVPGNGNNGLAHYEQALPPASINTERVQIAMRLHSGQVLFSPVMRVRDPGMLFTAHIQPNPVHAAMYLNIQADQTGALPVTVFDAQGRIQQQYRFHTVRGSNTLVLDGSKLGAGLYYIRSGNSRQSGVLCSFVKR